MFTAQIPDQISRYFFFRVFKLCSFNPLWTQYVKKKIITTQPLMFMYEHMCLPIWGIQRRCIGCACWFKASQPRGGGPNENNGVYERNSTFYIRVSFIFIIYYCTYGSNLQ